MIIYIAVLLLIVCVPPLLRKIPWKTERQERLAISLLCFFPIFLLFALKNISVGTDSKTYYSFFEATKTTNWSTLFLTKKEIAVYGLMKIFTSLNLSYYVFQFCFYLFVITPFVLIASKYCEYPELFALAFYTFGPFSFDMSALRQAGAVSVVCFGIYFLLNSKKYSWLVFEFFVLFGCLFHQTAIFAAFLPLLLKVRIKDRYFFFVFGGYAFFLLAFPYAYELSFSLFSKQYPGLSIPWTPWYSLAMFGATFLLAFSDPRSKRAEAVFSKISPSSAMERWVWPSYQDDSISGPLFESSLPVLLLISFLTGTSTISYVIMRLANYFLLFLGLSLSSYVSLVRTTKARLLLRIVFSGILVLYFVYAFLYEKPLSEIPYEFL